jgi:hypothetical protein
MDLSQFHYKRKKSGLVFFEEAGEADGAQADAGPHDVLDDSPVVRRTAKSRSRALCILSDEEEEREDDDDSPVKGRGPAKKPLASAAQGRDDSQGEKFGGGVCSQRAQRPKKDLVDFQP